MSTSTLSLLDHHHYCPINDACVNSGEVELKFDLGSKPRTHCTASFTNLISALLFERCCWNQSFNSTRIETYSKIPFFPQQSHSVSSPATSIRFQKRHTRYISLTSLLLSHRHRLHRGRGFPRRDANGHRGRGGSGDGGWARGRGEGRPCVAAAVREAASVPASARVDVVGAEVFRACA